MIHVIHCTNCHRPYPEEGAPYRCPTCGGIFDFVGPFEFDSSLVDPDQPGMWRYRHTFGLPESAPVVTLGEGLTPLIWGQAFGRRVAYKLEFLNPTGSFKDRGSAPLISFLRSRGVTSAVEDSSGNAGASFAAYAGRAGIEAQVFVPDSASGPKRRQIEAYGARVTRILGPRSNAAEAVRRAVEGDGGPVYASHAFLPQLLPGYATLSYELVEQLGQAPGSVILPAGQGNLLLAAARGFRALLAAGVIERMPHMYGVQARACAPLWAFFQYGPAGYGWVTEGDTLAEGVRIKQPMRGDQVITAVESSGGGFFAVDEEEILPGRDAFARQGLYIEATSAIVWSALRQSVAIAPEPVVAVLTGSGLKEG